MLDVECWAFDVCGRKFICVLPRQSERCLPPPQAATAWQATPLGMTILARSCGFERLLRQAVSLRLLRERINQVSHEQTLHSTNGKQLRRAAYPPFMLV